MSTPHSSVRLRRAVDAAAGPRHEVAFRILDLLLVERGSDGDETRAHLRRELDAVRAELEADAGG